MPAVTVPNTFSTGTQVIATPWNENFAALVNWINTYAIQKDASVAFTSLPSIPTTTPTLDAQVASRKYLNDTVRAKGDRYVTFNVVPGGNTDTNTSGVETDWITLIASQLVPAWATKCVLLSVINGHFAPTVTALSQAVCKIATIQIGTSYMSHSVANARNVSSVVGEGTVTSIANTTVAVKMRAIGTGNAIRIDGSSVISGYLRFYA